MAKSVTKFAMKFKKDRLINGTLSTLRSLRFSTKINYSILEKKYFYEMTIVEILKITRQFDSVMNLKRNSEKLETLRWIRIIPLIAVKIRRKIDWRSRVFLFL